MGRRKTSRQECPPHRTQRPGNHTGPRKRKKKPIHTYIQRTHTNNRRPYKTKRLMKVDENTSGRTPERSPLTASYGMVPERPLWGRREDASTETAIDTEFKKVPCGVGGDSRLWPSDISRLFKKDPCGVGGSGLLSQLLGASNLRKPLVGSVEHLSNAKDISYVFKKDLCGAGGGLTAR